jgi:hypothetical protein
METYFWICVFSTNLSNKALSLCATNDTNPDFYFYWLVFIIQILVPDSVNQMKIIIRVRLNVFHFGTNVVVFRKIVFTGVVNCESGT